ncbi:MAG: COG3014 family protein [Marinifilaceae bacterium]
MPFKRFFRLISLLGLILLTSSCASYYVQNQLFNEKFVNGEVEAAQAILDKDKKNQTNKNRVLYYLNKGTLLWMQEQYAESSTYFQKADHYIEDQRKNIGLEALALISNPGVRPYVPEDFESVMLHFYQALNYLEMENLEGALVECRRVNEKLYTLNDKYPKKYKNRYSDDAFAHILMGLIYDANKDYNNAFIAYRNAFRVYQENYHKNFNTQVPNQLKDDLLRTAYQSGLMQEYEFYKSKFGQNFTKKKTDEGEIIFFWMNGMGPVKSEWSINFAAVKGNNGFLTLANDNENVSFPFFIGNRDKDEQSAFGDLDFVRVAFPKYVERPPVFSNAWIELNDSTQYFLEKAEDVNSIAFKTLRDRMIREMANSLLRLASKKAMEAYVRKKNDNLGTLLSIANAITEKADTRNWQTLPHSIFYTRIRVPAGERNLNLIIQNGGNQQVHNFSINVKKGETKFISFHNLESESITSY